MVRLDAEEIVGAKPSATTLSPLLHNEGLMEETLHYEQGEFRGTVRKIESDAAMSRSMLHERLMCQGTRPSGLLESMSVL